MTYLLFHWKTVYTARSPCIPQRMFYNTVYRDRTQSYKSSHSGPLPNKRNRYISLRPITKTDATTSETSQKKNYKKTDGALVSTYIHIDGRRNLNQSNQPTVTVVTLIIQQMELHLTLQKMLKPFSTIVVSLIPLHGKMYQMQPDLHQL